MTKIYEFPVNPQKMSEKEKLDMIDNLAFMVHDFAYDHVKEEIENLKHLKYDEDLFFIVSVLEQLNEIQGRHETKVKKDDQNIEYSFVNDIPIGVTYKDKITNESHYVSKDKAIETILLADDVPTALQYAYATKETFHGLGDAIFDYKIDNLIRLLSDAQ